MFCRKCGNEIADGAVSCPHCGEPLAPAGQPDTVSVPPITVRRINTWLIPAITASRFCCMPFGIVSVVYAAIANTEIANHNFELAQEMAYKAKMWFWISFACGILSDIICFFVGLVQQAAVD